MDPEALGKITTGLDSVDARFVELVPNVRGVQAVDLIFDDSANAGTLTMTWALAAVNAGTNVHIRADDVPAGAMPPSAGDRARQSGRSVCRAWSTRRGMGDVRGPRVLLHR